MIEVWFCGSKLGHDGHFYEMSSGYDEQGIQVIVGGKVICTGWPAPGGPGFDTLSPLQRFRARRAYRTNVLRLA